MRPALTRTIVAVALVAAAALGVVAVVAVFAVLATPQPPAARATPAPVGEPVPPTLTDATADGLATLADAAWIDRVAAASGIPPRALASYAGAAIRMAESNPGCRLGWNTLAAIGFVESEHGTLGGGRIEGDGVARPSIVGIALDGTRSARIADTDQGALDGDDVWDRAVGPMQFVPQTWAAYGRDGDGDGRADPHQIDDAVLSAAGYLCDVGGDLSDPSRWIAAVKAYNADVAYNNRVAEAAAFYGGIG